MPIIPDDFYPTPRTLIDKMFSKIDRSFKITDILEPSAGMGDIIDAIKEKIDKSHLFGRTTRICAIEINEDFQNILRGKKIRVIDTDFLTYFGVDKFDLIIMNPPFNDGVKHLIKAINIMYRGQIICLLNASSLENPCTRNRQFLKAKLNSLNADIEYINGAFKDAKRPTGVSVALIHIVIDKSVDDEMFSNVTKAKEQDINLEEKYEVSTGNKMEELVAEYNEVLRIGQETILSFAKNRNKLSYFLTLETNDKDSRYLQGWSKPVQRVKEMVNHMAEETRKTFWRRTLKLDSIRTRLTGRNIAEFEQQMNKIQGLDFTERNVRIFIGNIVDNYKANIEIAVADLFSRMSLEHTYHDGPENKNIHLFNGWKTNKAHMVNKKVVLPVYGSYTGTSFMGFDGWCVNWEAKSELDDVDKVMSYFDGMNQNYVSIVEALEYAFKTENSQKSKSKTKMGVVAESTYFKIRVFKKGTCHLTFKDEGVWRRFNIEGCKGRNWLPRDYGSKEWENMTLEERCVAREFEGKKSYQENLGRVGIDYKNVPMISM